MGQNARQELIILFPWVSHTLSPDYIDILSFYSFLVVHLFLKRGGK